MNSESKDILDTKAYSHHDVESKWVKNWLEHKLFATQIRTETKKDPATKPFSMALPPPNVTGELHMGHALSGTIQDLLIRLNRMQGRDVLWQIGTDHAGIGTQIVVEKVLKKTEKIGRHQLGRDEFIKRVKNWKEEYGNKILSQMQILGFSPDWDRCRYTMDEHYSQSVKQAFKEYFEDSRIYRGKRVTNYCPKCKTSLSDLEIDKESIKGKLYHLKYPIKGKANTFIVVATTRPETMLGDTGVAVSAEDERYQEFLEANDKVMLPYANREIPIVADEHVKVEFGTGAVKVTPAHDPNDFEIAARHDLPRLITMDADAKMLPLDFIPKEIHGLDRYEAREKLLEMLEADGLLEKTTEYDKEKESHDRCHTEIEYFLTNQWYVAMQDLAKTALDTVAKDQSRFIPQRNELTFKNWLENIRDWCISRQIWWGHRIPVFYYQYEADGAKHISWFAYSGEAKELESQITSNFNQNQDELAKIQDLLALYDFEKNKLESGDSDLIASFGKSNYEEFQQRLGQINYFWQDDDVLDTWFSSALWPFETMKDDQKVFDHYYPTSALATAREIINLWVSRMIYSSQYFEKVQPFTDILIHPVVQTPDGKRMSKSKGNAIDPLEMVDLYGADASRMWYASVGIHGQQDVRFPGKFDKSKKKWSSDTLEQYRKFANKLFNASKFVIMNLDKDGGFTPKPIDELDQSKLNIADKWILSKFHQLLASLEDANSKYDTAAWAHGIYEFLWFNFCDWYIEFSKNDISEETKQILFHILEASLRALHPIMPFITEEIWQGLKHRYDTNAISSEMVNADFDSKYQESICFAKFPSARCELIKLDLDPSPVDHMVEVISAVRNARQTLGIPWTKDIKLYLDTKDNYEQASIDSGNAYIKSFTKASDFVQGSDAPKPSSSVLVGSTKLSIPLEGLVDLDKIKDSTQKKIDAVDKDIKGLESRLNSDNFVSNAPAEKVAEAKADLEKLLEKRGIYEGELANLLTTS